MFVRPSGGIRKYSDKLEIIRPLISLHAKLLGAMTTDLNNFGDFEAIPAVKAKASGAIGDELTFTYPEVLDLIALCSVKQIAVLGIELMKLSGEGLYQTAGLSVYDLSIGKDPTMFEEWPEYVGANNSRAEEFVTQNPAGDDHVYVLTTSSWRELGRIKELKKMR